MYVSPCVLRTLDLDGVAPSSSSLFEGAGVRAILRNTHLRNSACKDEYEYFKRLRSSVPEASKWTPRHPLGMAYHQLRSPTTESAFCLFIYLLIIIIIITIIAVHPMLFV